MLEHCELLFTILGCSGLAKLADVFSSERWNALQRVFAHLPQMAMLQTMTLASSYAEFQKPDLYVEPFQTRNVIAECLCLKSWYDIQRSGILPSQDRNQTKSCTNKKEASTRDSIASFI